MLLYSIVWNNTFFNGPILNLSNGIQYSASNLLNIQDELQKYIYNLSILYEILRNVKRIISDFVLLDSKTDQN